MFVKFELTKINKMYSIKLHQKNAIIYKEISFIH